MVDIDTFLLEARMNNELLFERVEMLLRTVKDYHLVDLDGIPSFAYKSDARWLVVTQCVTINPVVVEIIIGENNIRDGYLVTEIISSRVFCHYVPYLFDSSYTPIHSVSQNGIDFHEVFHVENKDKDKNVICFRERPSKNEYGEDVWSERYFVRVFEDEGETFMARPGSKWRNLSKEEYYSTVFDKIVHVSSKATGGLITF